MTLSHKSATWTGKLQSCSVFLKCAYRAIVINHNRPFATSTQTRYRHLTLIDVGSQPSQHTSLQIQESANCG